MDLAKRSKREPAGLNGGRLVIAQLAVTVAASLVAGTGYLLSADNRFGFNWGTETRATRLQPDDRATPGRF